MSTANKLLHIEDSLNAVKYRLEAITMACDAIADRDKANAVCAVVLDASRFLEKASHRVERLRVANADKSDGGAS